MSEILLSDPVNRSAPLNRGLVGWWIVLPGWQGTGGIRFPNITGTKNHGTLSGFTLTTAWRGNRGRPGGWGSLLYDGSNDLVSIGESSKFTFGTTTPFSCGLWMRTTTTSIVALVTNWRVSGNPGWAMRMGDGAAGTVGMFMSNAAGSALKGRRGSTTVNDGAWHHAAFSYDGSDTAGGVSIYIDGKTQSHTNIGTSATGALASTAMQLASHDNFALNRFPGDMDDVRLYDRNVSAGEWAQLYHASKRGYPNELNRSKRQIFVAVAAPSANRLLNLRRRAAA